MQKLSGLDDDEWDKVINDADCSNMLSLDQEYEGFDEDTREAPTLRSKITASIDTCPVENLYHQDLLDRIVGLCPSRREKLIATLFFHEGLSLKEIAVGGSFACSESRISQILSTIKARIHIAFGVKPKVRPTTTTAVQFKKGALNGRRTQRTSPRIH